MDHWTRYWQSTTSLNSFAEGSSASGYHGELKAFWDNVFRQTDYDATILDLGTGNGALAVLALQFSLENNLRFSIHGNDAAAINPIQKFQTHPELAPLLAQIKFFPNTNNERLPIDDASLELITSQFAFEYGDMEASIQEIARVLKPRGRAVLMLHHADSFLIQDSKNGAKVLTDTLQQSPLFIQAELAIKLLSMSSTTRGTNPLPLYQAAAQTRHWIMQQLQQLQQKYGEDDVWINDVLGRVAQHMSRAEQLPPSQLLQSLHHHYTQLIDHLSRIQEQLQTAYGDERAEALIDTARQFDLQAGYSTFSLAAAPECDDPTEHNRTFAMVIELVKPDCL